MGKKKPAGAPPPPESPFNNPFGSLNVGREALPSLSATPDKTKPAPSGPARAVVRMERKGRGGKEVTVIEQLELSPVQLEGWLKSLKNSLGCGGAVEDRTLVLQGDQRERIPALLTEKGVRKVTLG